MNTIRHHIASLLAPLLALTLLATVSSDASAQKAGTGTSIISTPELTIDEQRQSVEILFTITVPSDIIPSDAALLVRPLIVDAEGSGIKVKMVFGKWVFHRAGAG
jgi:hypothetical protein